MKLVFHRSTCDGGEPEKGDWLENLNHTIPLYESYFWAEDFRAWFLRCLKNEGVYK
jgi:hypothetical protein